ncbi:unnamed protein product [Closterium sp. NIES-54]
MVEVSADKLAVRCSTRSNFGKPPERLSYHVCLPPTSYDTLLDDAQFDVDLPELDPDMHADPEHRWDIANMTVKEGLASWKGKAVKAAMDEEIRSLISNGTWELVERLRGVNVMKNLWVLMTKYHIDDTVAREKARLVVKGFTQVYGADYDETYTPFRSYIALRIFLSIVAVLDLHLIQLDMKNTFFAEQARLRALHGPAGLLQRWHWPCMQAAKELVRAEAESSAVLGARCCANGRRLEQEPGGRGSIFQSWRRRIGVLGARLRRRPARCQQ